MPTNPGNTNIDNGLETTGSTKNSGNPSDPFSPNKNKDNQDKQTLSDLTRGIQHAVNTAEEVLEQHYLRMLGRYFNEDNSPRMARIKVPPDSVIEVPLLALVTPTALKLDELTMDMTLRIDETEVKRFPGRAGRVVERSSFKISVGSGTREDGSPREKNQIDIRMTFKSGDIPEGVSRIMDEFTKSILPKKVMPKPETEKDKWKV